MMSFFQNPWLLAALAGAAIPIIIELLLRRRRRQVELPTIRYLLKSPAKKKIKRQDQLLLILRCLAPAVLALALARPLLSPNGESVLNRHVTIVLDQTLSMGQSAGAADAFSLAKNKARRLIELLPKGTRVSLVTLGSDVQRPIDHSDDLYSAGETVSRLKITHGSAPVPAAIDDLKAWLAEDKDKGLSQEVYFFSDFQKTAWNPAGRNGVAELKNLESQARLYLVDVGGEHPFNYYFTELAPEEPLIVTGQAVRFRATIEAKGLPPAGTQPHARVSFLINGQAAGAGIQDVPLKTGKATVTFEHRFGEPGEFLVSAEVEGDTHRLDNQRFYLATVSDSVKVLILDDTAAGGQISDEATELSAAIAPQDNPGLERNSIFSAKVVHPADIIRENLADYAAVVALGMDVVPDDVVTKLEPYVRDGGAAMFFLGGRTNTYEYGQKLFKDGKGLLAARPAKSEALAKDAAALKIRNSPELHPALAMPDSAGELPGAEITRYMEVEQASAAPSALFSNDKPAMYEKPYGKGRSVTFCMAAGGDECGLWKSYAYPIILGRLAKHLAGDPDRAVNMEIGQTFRQDVMVSAQHLLLRKPDGTKVRLTPQASGPEQLEVSFDRTDQMGKYEIDAQAGMLRRGKFVVNLSANEGDLDRLSEADFEPALSSKCQWVSAASPIETAVAGTHSMRELAGPLLVVLTVLLAVETFLAVRFGKRRH